MGSNFKFFLFAIWLVVLVRGELLADDNHAAATKPAVPAVKHDEGQGQTRPLEVSDLISMYVRNATGYLKEAGDFVSDFKQFENEVMANKKKSGADYLGRALELERFRIWDELNKIKKVDPSKLSVDEAEKLKTELIREMIDVSRTALLQRYGGEKIKAAGRKPNEESSAHNASAAIELARSLTVETKKNLALFRFAPNDWDRAFPPEKGKRSQYDKFIDAYGAPFEDGWRDGHRKTGEWMREIMADSLDQMFIRVTRNKDIYGKKTEADWKKIEAALAAEK